MAHTQADRLDVYHDSGQVTTYERVSYTPWPGGVAVFRDGGEIRHEDVQRVEARRRRR